MKALEFVAQVTGFNVVIKFEKVDLSVHIYKSTVYHSNANGDNEPVVTRSIQITTYIVQASQLQKAIEFHNVVAFVVVGNG